jgi:modulator of FtsH protease
MSGLILFDTSRIINGGETNYIRATVSLYLNVYNIFIHLLHLISALSGRN